MQSEPKEYFAGELKYTLTKKRIKNINLRINKNGDVYVSAPLRCTVKEVESFLLSKSSWIEKTQAKMLYTQQSTIVIDKARTNEAQALFEDISMQIFPLFSEVLNKELPKIKVRNMKSRWGVCHISKKYITLNLQLLSKPHKCIEYVVLHEYAHFVQPNHSKKFWDIVQIHMPDYKEWRKALKNGN